MRISTFIVHFSLNLIFVHNSRYSCIFQVFRAYFIGVLWWRRSWKSKQWWVAWGMLKWWPIWDYCVDDNGPNEDSIEDEYKKLQNINEINREMPFSLLNSSNMSILSFKAPNPMPSLDSFMSINTDSLVSTQLINSSTISAIDTNKFFKLKPPEPRILNC